MSDYLFAEWVAEVEAILRKVIISVVVLCVGLLLSMYISPSAFAQTDETFACLTNSGTTQVITGAINGGRYSPLTANAKKFDARGATFTIPRDLTHGKIYLSGSGQDTMCWAGGYITSTNDWHDLTVSWNQSKNGFDQLGTYRNTTPIDGFGDGLTITGTHIYNVHDGLRTTHSNNNWNIQHVWMDYVRDDCIENDSGYSGSVYDVLFDGCYSGISNQDVNVSGQSIAVDKMLIRMEPMPYPYKWDTKSDPKVYPAGYNNMPFGYDHVFKGDPTAWPMYSITNSVFLLEYDADSQIFPPQNRVEKCENNVIIWLDKTAPAPTYLLNDFPGCFTIITDAVAGKALWKQKVTDWHNRHPQVGADKKPANPGTYVWPRFDVSGTPLPVPTTSVQTTTPAPVGQFAIGDRVQVASTAGSVLNVRSLPSLAGVLLGTQVNGALGTVLAGPVVANGYTWWNIDYTTSPDGWGAENWLIDAVTTAPAPLPTAPVVTAPAPVSVVLTALPLAITAGQSSALTWSSSNATTCSGSNVSSAGSLARSVTVSPLTTTTYSITCTNLNGGTATDSVTVTVSQPVVETPVESSLDQVTVTVRAVGAGSDAEENLASGAVDIKSSDLELVNDASIKQLVGIRFQNINIPKGSTISAAYLQFTVDETDSSQSDLTIYGENVSDSAVFIETSKNISNRVKTSSSVSWSSVPVWSVVGSADGGQRTPNLQKIVQEVTDRSSWAAGNDMSFIISGTGERTAESYNGSATRAPQLIVIYRPAASAAETTDTTEAVTTVAPSPVSVPVPDTTPVVQPPAVVVEPTIRTVTPVADATISFGSPTVNYGTKSTLEVDTSDHLESLLSFNLSSVAVNDIVRATLRLYGVNSSDNGGGLYAASANWGENNVTWSTAPIAGALIVPIGKVTKGAWHEYDLTNHMSSDGLQAFRIVAASSDGADFSSREATTKPELVLTLQ